VQGVFGKIFNEGTEFARDGSQFDRLLATATLMIGEIPADRAACAGAHARRHGLRHRRCRVRRRHHVHARLRHRAGRLPRRRRAQLYRSVRRLMQLPDETRVFLCHDYKAPNRDHFVWETTMLAERTANVHLHDGVSEDEFVECAPSATRRWRCRG
jgi:hypothetical protein